MGVPCTPISTVDVAAGDGIDVTFLDGVYTVSVDAAEVVALGKYKVYADPAARDADNPTPSAGDAAYTQDFDRLWYYDGAGWLIVHEPWQTYTPSSTNITVGSGTLTGRYRRHNGDVTFWGSFTLGAGSAMGTNPQLGLPKNSAALLAQALWVSMSDGSSAHYVGIVAPAAANANVAVLFAANTSVAIGVTTSITSSVPFSWGTGDVLGVGGTYEMFSPYL